MHDSPAVYNRQIDIRQLLIDWVTANHTIDPTTFGSRPDWFLAVGGADITPKIS